MSDWTSGYVADVGYTYGYYQELNPLRVRLAFLNIGQALPDEGTHCELGFGQGLSVNMHAAASGSMWHANDFNPAQAGFAKTLAQASGANIHLTDQAFADFCQSSDLPDFDSIGLHGIWSWISDENRSVIVDFVRRKLKVGGVLYISYNTYPGWAAFAPMRDLLLEHKKAMAAPGHGVVANIEDALTFAEKLMATNPLYARANPTIRERLSMLKIQDRNYLAHEYFNRNWLPMNFATMAGWLSPAKLNYACSAHYIEHIDAISLSADQRTLLREIPDEIFRETVRDFMVNQQFRRDYWVKGARKLNPLAQAEAFRAQRIILVQPRGDVNLKAKGALGEATLREGVYNPVLDALADHKAKTLGQIEQAVKGSGLVFEHVREVAMVLCGIGSLTPVQDDTTVSRAKKQTDKLNAHVLEQARGRSDLNYLASPLTGGGVAVNRLQQLFLLAISQGKKQPAEWVPLVWQTLAAQNQKIIKEGKMLDTPEENLAELTLQANTFAEKQWPILRALQVA